MSAEKRNWPRRMVNTRISFVRVGDSEVHPVWSGWVREVSDGGVSVETDAELTEGAQVEMCVKLYEGGAEERVRGRVVWVRATEGGVVAGVRFIDLCMGEEARDGASPA